MEKEARRRTRCAKIGWMIRSRTRARNFHSRPCLFESFPHEASAGQATCLSDRQRLRHILDACKRSLDFVSASKTHATIAKAGYHSYPSLTSTLMATYLSCGHLNLASQLLNESLRLCFDLETANRTISSFMKDGSVDFAKRVFEVMPYRDVVSWNSVIGGCVKNGCAHLGAISHAEWVHSVLTEKGITLNHILHSALVNMYAKCGRIEFAKEIFESFERPCLSAWNAMINGLAVHGLAADAISVFSQMGAQNIVPDALTFVGILTACSHSGLAEEGILYFDCMSRKYNIDPLLEHYGAMVDLFSRVGRLEEAYAIIRSMPMKPDTVIWRAFLSACKTHRNLMLGETAFGNMFCLDSGDYVLLSNTYSSMLKWNTAAFVRDMMRREGVHKDHGKSWVEMGDIIHQFKAGDRSHPEIEAIYKILEGLIKRAKLQGYVHATQLVLMDVSEEEKEDNLTYHSEKIAVAFLVLKTCPGTAIQVSKNLRTCHDCHEYFKIVSRMLSRTIIVRDRIRFHRFERGSCSCGDFW